MPLACSGNRIRRPAVITPPSFQVCNRTLAVNTVNPRRNKMPKVSHRILIVYDESDITAILSDLLSTQYECSMAGSAEQALVRLQESEFELVISDITMPGMSGLDMIPHVKTIAPDTVVVMISGMQTVESAIGALRLGAFDYLMKPFDLRQVEAVVKRALEHHELIVAKQRYENHLEELVEQRTAELDRALDSLENIDVCARIFSVADAFDAITSDRVYRQGKSYEAAAKELDDWAGRQFDPL